MCETVLCKSHHTISPLPPVLPAVAIKVRPLALHLAWATARGQRQGAQSLCTSCVQSIVDSSVIWLTIEPLALVLIADATIVCSICHCPLPCDTHSSQQGRASTGGVSSSTGQSQHWNCE